MPNNTISEPGEKILLLPECCETSEPDLVNCSFCNEAFEDDGEELCPECREHTHECVACGERVHEDDCHESEDGDAYCASCYREKFNTCHHCHSEIESSDSYTGPDDENYCESCYGNYFTRCESCGELIWQEDSHYSEIRGETLCESCYCECGRASGALHEHHNWEGELRFHHVENGAPVDSRWDKHGELYLGVELETDGTSCNYDTSSCAEALSDLSENESLFHMEDDGSLRNGGLEIITQPATLEYLRKCFPWKDILRIVIRHGGKSHDSEYCGLHVHFNSTWFGKEYNLHTLKLLYIFERWWNQIVLFSRRSGSNWQQYAMRYNDNFSETQNASQKIRETKRKGRYFAVNIENENTIELRIFKGTLNIDTLMAALEFVDFLARFVKTVSIGELQAMSWLDLVSPVNAAKYPELIAYLVHKSLNTAQLFESEDNE